MKVILNTESVRFPLTGIGRYTYELAKALQKQEALASLRFFAAGQFVSLPEEADCNAAPMLARGKLANLKAVLQKSSMFMEVYRNLAEVVRSNGLKGHQGCIYHGPNFFLPQFDGPSVATFHDLSPFTWAHCHEPAKVRYMQKELHKTLKRADRLITDSEYTRQELAAYFNYPLERIDAVPLACADVFRPRTQEEVRAVLQRLGLDYQGYTLFVGTIEPRKNITTLLDAYEQLPLALRKRWPLVLTGYKGWASEHIHARIRAAQQQGWARYLGYLPAEDLPLLYAGARLFAFPSHYEGFGLPVLEALSSGIPVLCSNSSSLPEVAGGAALLHQPEDVGGLLTQLSKGLEDCTWRQQAVARGLEHAQRFTWQRCADQTMAVYQKLKSVGG